MSAPAELRAKFEAMHEERYGYRDPEQQLQLVTIRASATVPGADVELSGAAAEEPARARRSAILSGERVELDVLRGAPPPGTAIASPAIVELPESTLLVPPGWFCDVDSSGTVQLKR
jgi:N-methylhydantoinase A